MGWGTGDGSGKEVLLAVPLPPSMVPHLLKRTVAKPLRRTAEMALGYRSLQRQQGPETRRG